MALGPGSARAPASSVSGSCGRAPASASVDAPDGWAHTPTESLWVTADDGVALHVEIDAPDLSSLSRRHLAGRTPDRGARARLQPVACSAGCCSAGP